MLGSAQLQDAQQLRELVPSRTDRGLLVGQTGSGKTTLARYLLAYRKYKVVADYKGRINWPEYKLHTRLKTLIKDKSPSLLYRPNYGESVDEDARSRFWEWVYRRGNCTVYNDETAATTDGNTYPYYLGACLMRGREDGIELWSATQRPKDIPQIVLSESEHFYVFRLQLPQDREKVEAVSGINRVAIAELQKQQFYYSTSDGSAVGPMKLILP